MTKNKNEKSIKISIVNNVDSKIEVYGLAYIEVLGLLRLYEQRISLQMLSNHVIKPKDQ